MQALITNEERRYIAKAHAILSELYEEIKKEECECQDIPLWLKGKDDTIIDFDLETLGKWLDDFADTVRR